MNFEQMKNSEIANENFLMTRKTANEIAHRGCRMKGCSFRPQSILGDFLIKLSSVFFDFVDDAF
jgi:hypothetical protein